MTTIQWRPVTNSLTVPLSYSACFIPRNSAGIKDLAADIARQHPNFNKNDILTILRAEDKAIQTRLLNGEQVTKEGFCSWSLAFSGRLDSPNDPLPPLKESLHVSVRVSPSFVKTIRQNARTERLPMRMKLPQINRAEETLLKLNNVLSPSGVLQLSGTNLQFDPEGGSGSCVIEGTRSGTVTQTHFPVISNTSIMLMPQVPEQDNPWNNEYRISVNTHYSEHGTLRSGTYGRMLRAPLTLSGFGNPDQPEVGMLTGSADSPYVSAVGSTVTAGEILRIQALHDVQQDKILFNLLDMEESGKTGGVVVVGGNGEYTLPGFTDSAVSSLDIRVNDYDALKKIIRNDYGGRLVDILQVTL
ncbi:MAG: hypothetical protein Q3M30_06575 [Candidatus Electrothrix sp. Rat3]|nr:hypothetical protein [Candidatus Electrothrix rattekaaiensis]